MTTVPMERAERTRTPITDTRPSPSISVYACCILTWAAVRMLLMPEGFVGRVVGGLEGGRVG
jgi:hypothetical protein